MTHRYHAGPTFTSAQQAELDAAFSAWLDVEAIAENDEWRNETLVQASITTFAAYEALRLEFEAANATPADESYMHSHPGNGWGL